MQKDFVNNMAHEFKTPISTISISAETIGNPDILDRPDGCRIM
jgi:two-component system phosphate regulon sensor histidine kinase PhoR